MPSASTVEIPCKNAATCGGRVFVQLDQTVNPAYGASLPNDVLVRQTCSCELSEDDVERMVEGAGYRKR